MRERIFCDKCGGEADPRYVLMPHTGCGGKFVKMDEPEKLYKCEKCNKSFIASQHNPLPKICVCGGRILFSNLFTITFDKPSYYRPDPINSPSHYTKGGIETIDYMKAKMPPDEFKGYLKGNVIKYVSRAGIKTANLDLQDFKKAQWYLNRLINELEETK